MNDGILYDGKWYGRGEIRALSTIRSKSMVSEECGINTLTAEIYSEDVGDNPLMTVFGDIYAPIGYDAYVVNGPDIRQYTPFAPVELWRDGVLLGKYYLTSISRLARNWFQLNACSPIGIIDQLGHKGGLYSQKTFSQVCADIIGNAVTYSVDAKIANLPINGWLPYATARENLQQLLFATGAAATYDASGNLLFKYNEPDVSVDVPDGRLYQGGSVAYPSKASKVTVVEHGWFKDDSVEPETLFDNTGATAVTNSLVVFDEPYHTLVGSGLTVTPVNCNCCYVTGVGTLTGKKYAHTQREIVQEDATLKADERRIDSATLVSSLNSLNTLRRVYNYYRNADEVSYGIVNDGSFKCGDLINFTDPFGDDVSGYVKEMTETMSGIIKSDTLVATNWKPKYLGNTYEHSMVVKASDLVGGVWTVPSAMRGNPALFVLFGGAQGGQGGFNGADGSRATGEVWHYIGGLGGQGGKAGAPGQRGNYLSVELPSLAASYAMSIGAGGNGGAPDGGEGQQGGATTLTAGGTVYTTANGQQLPGTYYDLISGTPYALPAPLGFAGADGGKSVDYDLPLTTVGENGGAVGSYRGGRGIAGATITYDVGDWAEFYGAAGGGAAYGSNGGDAFMQPSTYGSYPVPGDGADAVAPSAAQNLGQGGAGGNGGGGGAGGTIEDAITYISPSRQQHQFFLLLNAGDGGSGSSGGKGSDGFALIYY